MPILKKVLLYKYLYYFVFLIIIVISFIRINIPHTSAYSEGDEEFVLKVLEIKNKENHDIITFQGKEKLICYIKEFPYDVGDIVKIKGKLIRPKNNTIPNTFNYKIYLQSRGVYWELDASNITLVKENSNLFYKFKKMISNRIKKISNYEYLYAFIVGDTSYINSEIKEKYQTIGLSYLLSLGSFQIMMITIILDKLRMSDRRKLILKIVVIIVYIMFTNMVIGVLRSGLCFIFKSVLKYKKVKYRYSNIILIIGIILLIINPFYIREVGFLYSFSISLAISILYKKIKGNYYKRLLKISLIAFCVSLPITMYSNYEINFLSIVFSFILIPLFHFIVFPLSIIVFIFPNLSFLFDFIIHIIEFLINIFSSISISVFVFRKPSMVIIIIYYLIVILFFYNKKYLFLLVIMLFIHHNINLIMKEDIITFLDVKQGDSILLKSNSHLTLIDTGGSNNYEYSTEIVKYIKSLGLSKINNLYLTHGDMDHLGSSFKLVDKIKINQVFFNNNDLNSNEKKLIELLNKKHVKYRKINNYNYKINSFDINVKSYNLNTENDSSMVFLIKYKNIKLLLMGDATVNTERLLMSDYNLSKINILKLGHHGSKTSTGELFYNVVKPDISIISVGDKNIYHLPNYEVLNRIKSSKVYKTSTSGSITFKFLSNKIKIMECIP